MEEIVANTMFTDVIVDSIKRFHEDYERTFKHSSEVGEYYGRGQLEGLAAGLWRLFSVLSEEEQLYIRERLTSWEWSYLMVWGEDRWAETEEGDDDDN